MSVKLAVHVQPMNRSHSPEVLEIMNLQFRDATDVDELDAWVGYSKNVHAYVAKYAKRVCGIIIYERKRKCIDIKALAVHPSCLRQGIGTAMVWNVFAKRNDLPVRYRVRDSYLPAQLFAKALGFKASGLWIDKDDGSEFYDFYYDLG